MDVTPKKKKIIIKVKPHTVSVGPKKPENGGKGVETPVDYNSTKNKRGLWEFLKKCGTIVKEDFSFKKKEADALIHDDPSWEEYLRFRELAMKGKKE